MKLEVVAVGHGGIFVRHPSPTADLTDLAVRYGIIGVRNERYQQEANRERQRRQACREKYLGTTAS